MAKKPAAKKEPTAKKANHLPDGWTQMSPWPSDDETASPYSRLSKRIVSALHELNEALCEAHKMSEMSVHIYHDGGLPRQYTYRIYRLTHSEMRFKLEPRFAPIDGVTDWARGQYEPTDKPETDERAA